MPETKISTCAQKTGVRLDKLYATEEREGGSLALGDDIPCYAPELLNVLPLQEWGSKKKDFILETWLGAMKKTIAGSGP